MQVHIAKTLDDVRNVREFMEDQTWEHARKFLTAAPAKPFADHLRWVEDDGGPVACVQVFLHRYLIGCAELGVCLPEYPFVSPEFRGRGYFKYLMSDLFDWMRGHGYPLAYDHGRKGLYTNNGYAPCFHHCVVLIRVADALRVHTTQRAEVPTRTDVVTHQALFRRPFPLGRGLQCRDERWVPDPRCVRMVSVAGRRAIRGFVVLGQVLVGRDEDGNTPADFKPLEGGEVLTITDSWAANVPIAATLLHTVAEEARESGFQWIRLNCRRGDVVARLAVLTGGELRWSAGQERDCTPDGEDVDAFYLAELKLAIKQLLPELNARWKEFTGDAPLAIRLSVEDEEVVLSLGGKISVLKSAARSNPVVRLSRKAMTRAIMGYATPTELSILQEGCDVPPAHRALLDTLFPGREPHLIHEGLAFAKPDQFGLVP